MKMDGAREAGLKYCAGCGGCIFDQFFLFVADKTYHSQCLKCSLCQTVLEDEMTCYYKEGRILCKFDYYKRYRSPRCSGCDFGIAAEELVMRMGEMVYHLGCFRCCICTEPLQTGEQYGMGENALLFCHRHMNCLPHPNPHVSSQLYPPQQQPLLLSQKIEGKCEKPAPKTRARKRRNTQMTNPPDDHFVNCNPPPPIADCIAGLTNMSSMSTITPMHHLRPSQNSNVAESSPEDGANSGASDNAALLTSRHESSSPTSSTTTNHNGSQPRTKRMRTSFKHQQLRSMKQYFLINHNPDAKDLKQLAQKTGLTKRVLQVWFQNARAKFRRSMLKQSDRDQTDPRSVEPASMEKTMSLSPATESHPSYQMEEMQNSV